MTSSLGRNKLRTITSLVAVVLLTVLHEIPSHAEVPVEADSSTNYRTIDRTNEKSPLVLNKAMKNSVGTSEITHFEGVLPLPNNILVQPGDTVLIKYSDGVMLRHQKTLGCGISSYASTPYVNPNSGYPQAQSVYRLSEDSGCPTNTPGHTGSLWGYRNWAQGQQVAHDVYLNPAPGKTASATLYKRCANTSSGDWKVIVGSPVLYDTGNANINCRW